MTLQEFETISGIKVTMFEYKTIIEPEYSKSKFHLKEDFIRSWKKRGGILKLANFRVEVIQKIEGGIDYEKYEKSLVPLLQEVYNQQKKRT